MAKYRNVEDIREVLYRYAHNKHSKAFSKFLMSEIERKNKPDVIERSKIDKAIEEMQNHREFSHADFKQYAEENGLQDCEDYHFTGLRTAIEILKRNIGE